MSSHLLHAATVAAFRRPIGCCRRCIKNTPASHLPQEQTPLPLYSRNCISETSAYKLQHMGLLQHHLHTMVVKPPAAAIRASSGFSSPAAAGVNCSSDRCRSRKENGDRPSSSMCPAFPFTRVTDNTIHWLPSLARAKIRQGTSFSRLSAAARGDSSSADVQAVEEKALAAIKREQWSVPRAAIVLFSAQWNQASRELQQLLSIRLSATAPFISSKNETGKAVAAEFAVVSSEEAPLLLKVFGVSALPHCLLMVNGRVVYELPAGASAARRESYIATVSSAVSTAPKQEEQTLSPRSLLLDRLESAVRRRSPRDLNEIETLLHILKEDLMPPADANEHTRPSPSPRRAFGVRNMKEGPAFHFSLRPENSDRHQPASRAGYLLDSDERAAQLAALATVALFDVPEVHTLDLQALHELLSWTMQSKTGGEQERSGKGGAANKSQKEAPFVRAGLRTTLEKLIEREEPQWAPDDCPIIRRLPLYNQCLLNKSLFAKARGAQPRLSPRPTSESSITTTTITTTKGAGTSEETTESIRTLFSHECFKVELWMLAEWLARTRRCLAARLFLEKDEALGLELAMTAHVEWLKGAAQRNYMQVNVAGYQGKTACGGRGTAVSQTKSREGTLQEEIKKKHGVHPFNVWFEPRAPSAGRTLLACMYTALGPDDRRVQQTIGRFVAAIKAHEFYPVKFPHTKARRGGKPRMMRGRSGRWFWLGPYWKPPWAPKRISFTEDWHLTNVAA